MEELSPRIVASIAGALIGVVLGAVVQKTNFCAMGAVSDVMIFGNWTPLGAFGGGLLFGFADSVAARLGILTVNIRPEILLMVPYIATMVVLAGVVGRERLRKVR